MPFRSFIFCSVFFVPVFELLGAIQTHPIGIVIRPQFLEQLVLAVNTEPDEASPKIEYQGCFEGLYFEVQAQIHLKKPTWRISENQILSLDSAILAIDAGAPRTRLPGLQITGELRLSCADSSAPRIPFAARIEEDLNLSLKTRFDTLRIDMDVGQVARLVEAFIIETPDHPNIQNIINNDELNIRGSLGRMITSELCHRLSLWLDSRLRGLVFTQSITQLFQKSNFWHEGLEIEAGAIQLKNTAEAIERKQIFFVSYPRADNSIYMDRRQVEIYLNAGFLGAREVREFLGIEDLPSSEATSELIENQLKSRAISPDAIFTRPLLPTRTSHLSLLIPESLFNEALFRIYQEDLASFSTSILFGEHVKGLIAPLAPEVSVRVDLGSGNPPSLSFQPNAYRLSVTDYVLRLGTWIEDRLIPQTEIKASVQLRASPRIDFQAESVNLAVDANSFRIDLREEGPFRNRLSSDDIELLQKLASEVWKTFFSNYPELVLFPTIFQSTRALFEIEGIEVIDGMTFIHINLDGRSIVL